MTNEGDTKTAARDVGARVDVAFPLAGERVPQDHGYALFGALCRVLGDLHGADWLAVHPIAGLRTSETELDVDAKSRLRLRVPVDRIGSLLPLSGRVLELDRHRLRLGVPSIHTLGTPPSLAARMVSIRLIDVDLKDEKGSEQKFGEALARQLATLQVSARVELLRRRVMTVREQKIVGWGVRLFDLSEADSLKVQTEGLGGRRRFGCGVFSGPAQEREA